MRDEEPVDRVKVGLEIIKPMRLANVNNFNGRVDTLLINREFLQSNKS